MLKSMSVRTTIAAILAGLSLSAHAIADPARPINVPAGELVVALETLSRQAAVDLVFQPEQLKSFRTDGVSGTYSPQDAIRILLKGTPLQLRTDASSGAMVIAPPAAPGTSSSRIEASSLLNREGMGDESKSFWSRLRLAETDAGSQGESQGGNREQVVRNQDVEDPTQRQKRVELEEIVVTGTRIPGDETARPLPVHTFTTEDIRRSGQTSVTDFLNTLPSVSTNRVEAQGGSAGSTTVALRGLKPGSTLILLNGRRIESGGVNTFAFDLNLIPAAAISRIDVLPFGSSAIYGGDALAGVVNFVMAPDYSGGEFYSMFGSADGTNEVVLSASQGWAGEKFSVAAFGSYNDRGALNGKERELTASDDYRSYGSTDARLTFAHPANISAVSGSLPGLPCSLVGIPHGSSGVGLTPSSLASQDRVPGRGVRVVSSGSVGLVLS